MAATSASSPASAASLLALSDSSSRSLASVGPISSSASLSLLGSEEAESNVSLHGLAGRSPVMRRLIQQMKRMAPHLTLATIEGEEGTGRTTAARALHAAGPAAAGLFVPCPAIQFFSNAGFAAIEADTQSLWPEEVLRQADGGMLFLDRVHQLTPIQQKSLADFLHWFDDRHFRAQHPTASNDSARFAAEANLPAQIVFSASIPLRNPGCFREDLASRLCAVRFRLPQLSERREDIPLLAQIFIQRFARTYGKTVRGLGPGTIAPLLRYPWPGNVRELEQTINAAALETESQWIRPIDLPPLTASHRSSAPASAGRAETSPETDFNLDRAIRSHVARVLARTRGNKLRAAQLLGISRSTLYRILAAEPSAGQNGSLDANSDANS